LDVKAEPKVDAVNSDYRKGGGNVKVGPVNQKPPKNYLDSLKKTFSKYEKIFSEKITPDPKSKETVSKTTDNKQANKIISKNFDFSLF
jgi:hypothetical protein